MPIKNKEALLRALQAKGRLCIWCIRLRAIQDPQQRVRDHTVNTVQRAGGAGGSQEYDQTIVSLVWGQGHLVSVI